MSLSIFCPKRERVAPFAGAWIEITNSVPQETARTSLPSRERGLKYLPWDMMHQLGLVAPFAGAWIEMYKEFLELEEIRSLPSRERGLK